MLAESRAREIVETVLAAAKKEGAAEAEVHLGGGRSALSRFAANEIHQNVESERYDVSLRVVIGRRTARTSTSRLDAAGFTELAKRTVEVAKLVPEDPSLLPVVDAAEGGDAPGSSAVDPATDACSPEERAALVKKVADAVGKAGYDGAGYLSTGRGAGTMVYGNSKGLFRTFDRTSAGFSLTVTAKDSSGYCEAQSPKLASMDVPALAARAIEKARASAAPADVEPGAWDVILEPAAVQSLTEFLGWGGFTGRAYEEGDTWSAGLLGKKVFGENVTLRDDFSDVRNPGPSWDEEGLRRQKLLLIDKGVLSSLCWDRRSARKSGTVPTGHGFRIPNLWGAGPGNVVMDGGAASLDSLIASTKRGILVTRFWYNRLVDPKRVVVTGMTRDGTFLVEDGKITKGVKNMRFNQGVIEMLNHVEALGPVDPSFLVPALKVSGFTFSSKTRF